MEANPFVGVVLLAIGAIASASFYVPFKKVREWAWESYWLVGGVFSWIIAPWVLAAVIIGWPTVVRILQESPGKSMFWSYFFGVLWGVGGLTFGLSVRYLGIGLGIAIALGFCAAFGTLVPPIFTGEFSNIIQTTSGSVILGGVLACMVGIATNGLAGMAKEREVSEEQKKESVQEFNFVKGLLVAIFAGVMSACMSFGFAAGKPIGETAVRLGASTIWQNLPVLIVILAGGFTTNFIWCVLLNIKNKTGRDYLSAVTYRGEGLGKQIPVLANYFFAGLAGTTWYMQFFFYGMGETKMGKYSFSSWTIYMASVIVMSTFWAICLREWKGTSARTRITLIVGLIILIGSIAVVGYGNFLAGPK